MPGKKLISIFAALFLSLSIFTVSCSNTNLKKVPVNIKVSLKFKKKLLKLPGLILILFMKPISILPILLKK